MVGRFWENMQLVLAVLLLVTGILATSGTSYASDDGGFEQISGEQVDAVSGATEQAYTTSMVVERGTLATWVNNEITGAILSTTNENGTPHATLIHPVLESDEVIRFALSRNQTRDNLDRTGQAFLTVYGRRCGAKKPFGARLELHLVPVEGAGLKTKGIRVMKMSIAQVLPLE